MIKFSHFTFLFSAALFMAVNASATGSFWRVFEGTTAPAEGKRSIIPEHYIIRMLDQPSMALFLEQLPKDPAKGALVTLPSPDGKERSFKIWQTPLMQEPLQSRYSQIRTFTAVATDNPAVTAKLDYTPAGFHAMVFDGNNTFFIDPYAGQADGYYTVYYKRDFVKPEGERMACGFAPGETGAQALQGNTSTLDARQNGDVKKTYRLAVACTGEYAVAVAGPTPTKANVLAAIVTSVNRVNGIYERELAVSLVLIGNTDTLIYLNGGTDPLTNANIYTLIDDNQNNTNAVIGSANYDIGHVFSTSSGGGLAEVHCVCNDALKARGATGLANPTGDPYDVDYVSHEMGHQFGAKHIFNKCSNEVDTSAYEPGSGSTIMSYAGVCGSINNLQLHSDAYFHAKSLTEISDYITLGQGATCPVTSAGGTLPVVASISAAYNIPYQTPFELQAPEATAAPSDSMTYCWEQWNRGNFQQNESGGASFTTGPSLRSFYPSGSRWRVFPRIDSLIRNNIAYRGERLSIVARPLDFKLTVRNMVDGIGAYDLSDDSVHIDVINTGQPFMVTSPNTASFSAYGEQPITVTWNIAQTDQAPISTANVDIYLSVDGGYTYPFNLAQAVPNSGTATVTLPDTGTLKARIKVKGSGNIFFDISDANFKITDTTNVNSIADIKLNADVTVYPNPATSQIFVKNSGSAKLEAVLYTAVGQKVWSGTVNKQLYIPVSDMARGLYFLELRSKEDGGKAVKRLTLQ